MIDEDSQIADIFKKDFNQLIDHINLIVNAHNKQVDKIEILNNIINELEHHLYQEWLEWKDSDCESIYSRAGEDKAIYDYLQELKGRGN